MSKTETSWHKLSHDFRKKLFTSKIGGWLEGFLGKKHTSCQQDLSCFQPERTPHRKTMTLINRSCIRRVTTFSCGTTQMSVVCHLLHLLTLSSRPNGGVMMHTSMMMTSLPRSVLTSSTHRAVFRNEALSGPTPQPTKTLFSIPQQDREPLFPSHALVSSHILAAGFLDSVMFKTPESLSWRYRYKET